MPESRRHTAASVADTSRDARTEALLVNGLDHYFSGRFEDAIHIWTRVLFLDRTHARARAYIDRARTAIAERQRIADEMLHASTELLTRGDAAEARRVLTAVVDTTGDDERAAELRTRIERVERAGLQARPGTSRPPAVVDAVPMTTTRGWLRRWGGLAIAVAGGAAVAALVMTPAVREWVGLGTSRPALEPAGREAARPVLSSSDVALVRARTLYSRGRLAEALQVLDRVREETSRSAANQLRVEIQQILLSTGASAKRADAPRSAGSAGRE